MYIFTLFIYLSQLFNHLITYYKLIFLSLKIKILYNSNSKYSINLFKKY